MTTPEWHHIALVILAYLIGGVSPGYWLARTRGFDLRNTGSHSTGASNAGRVLGSRGFYAVVCLDVLKGMAVSCVAQYVMTDNTPPWQFAAALAVVAGHVWSVWLGFRGGKGVAPFYGAWAPLGNWAGLIPLFVCVMFALILRLFFRRSHNSFKTAWLASLVIYPAAIWCVWHFLLRNPAPLPLAVIAGVLVLLIWIAHRRNIATAFKKTEKPEGGLSSPSTR